MSTLACRYCSNPFDLRWKGQLFCSRSCANKARTGYRHSSNVIARIKASVSAYQATLPRASPYPYSCDKCGAAFTRATRVRPGSPVRCPQCRRRAVHKLDVTSLQSILQLSSRTVMKVLQRLGLRCSHCDWGACACDVHHIVPRSEGGSNAHTNLTYLCPNCHRLAHAGKLKDFVTLDTQIGESWRKAYAPR